MTRHRPGISDRRRATLGTLLLVMPVLFLLAVSLKHGLAAPDLFDSFQAELLDRGHQVLRPLTAGLIVLGPPLALGVNLPAVLRLARRRRPDRLASPITVVWKPLNAAVVAVGLVVTLVFFSYGVAEHLVTLPRWP